MHILQIYKDYPPVQGGIEGHVALLAEGLVARGHQVTVLYSALGRQTSRTQRNGVQLWGIGRLVTLASTPLSPGLPWFVARARPDLIHLHHPHPPGDLAALLAGRASPLVVSYHSDIVRQRRLAPLVQPLIRRSLHRAGRIIAASPTYIRTSPLLAPLASRCRVIPYGQPLDQLAQADPAAVAAWRARFPGPIILFVGRLRYYKGLDQLIRAMASVPAQALIVGGEASVQQRDLINLAHDVGVAERIHLLGALDEASLRALYHAADVFVLPSNERSEAFGIVQVEAQAAGLPVVCTELGTGTSYVTQHGRTGIVVPPNDVTALARALRVLVANPALARAMGQAGRARASAEFGLERMLDRIEAVYHEAIHDGVV
ncbi:MAG: glycosyltransferase [Oscillochloridaceae bacterium umkhey_bin13]